MTTTVTELLTAPTPDDNLRALFAFLALKGLPATSWQSGSVPRTLLAAEAEWLSDLGVAIQNVAKGGWLDDAEGDWLTLLAWNLFQVERAPATFTIGRITLTDSANAGPFTIDPNSIVVADGSRSLRFQYSEDTTYSLALGGSVSILVQAESAGAAYNLGAAAVSVLLTALPGVSVTNAVDWITQQGKDEESDASLRARCRARWSTLGTGSNEDAYLYWARSVPGVTDARVVSDPATGIVTVYVRGPAGPAGAGVVAAVDAILQAKRPLTVRVVTSDVTASATPITGVLYVNAGYELAATVASAQNAIAAVARATDVGCTIVRDKIIQVAMEVPGVRDFALTSPAENVSLGSSVAFTPAFAVVGAR